MVVVVVLPLLFVDGVVVISAAASVLCRSMGKKYAVHKMVMSRHPFSTPTACLPYLASLQVEDTMKNPEFMKEMKSMMETPEIKAALAKVTFRRPVRSFVICYGMSAIHTAMQQVER